ncbi:hypothetical protein RvY_02044-3 [Ramazzottius varieornatus]|uniref:Transporter n=1 Tax=Ramazzottius varieornatus TaxID=947166 RepID=A0A1D1UQE8_RAMVA|nr:hypothetical protein RvY_02044-3 [Ramazzottius varieornatus]
MAGHLGLPVSRVVREGPGLVFAIFPDAITRMPVPTFWAILFNLMLLCFGLDTQFAIIETVVTGITDLWPGVRNSKRWIILIVCSCAFLIGLLFTTKAGLYWVRLFDYFVASWPLILFAFLEMTVILIYGAPRFARNITEMIGRNISYFYRILWYTLVPLSTLFLVLASWATHQPLDYNGMVFPHWTQAVGWLLAVLPVLLIPAYALYHVLTEVEDTQQSFMAVLRAYLVSSSADIRRGAKEVLESPGSALASPRRIPPVSSITGRRMPNESELVPALTVISRAQGPLNIDFRETHV